MVKTWSTAVLTLGLITVAAAINRPVYKVVLSQNGFTQFLQYDVETPPIREFTFCTWIKVYNFQNQQTIFTYIVNGNKRVVRLWLDSGGHHLKVLFNERELSTVLVEIEKDIWRHICLTFQSDVGAWAVYLDSHLITCESAQALQFFIIPAGGSVILGYGTTDQGNPNGLEGEIFGANMILSSTIARNATLKNHPLYVQKAFQRNKLRGSKNIDYIILGDLITEESSENINQETIPPWNNKTSNFIKVQTDGSVRSAQASMTPKNVFSSVASHESDIFDLVMNSKPRQKLSHQTNTSENSLWDSLVQNSPTGRFKISGKNNIEQSNSETQDFPLLSEFETPPPPRSTRTNYFDREITEKMPLSNHKFNNVIPVHHKTSYRDEISEIELPPPPVKDTKVYGQWTSSKYAGSVLNYLKSINFYNKEKRVPTTIPLTKVSDNFPYASILNARVVRPPTNLQKKSMLTDKRLHDQYIHPTPLKRLHIIEKRDLNEPEINVKILEDDSRTDILKSHARTKPKNVQIISRGNTFSQLHEENHKHRHNYEDKYSHSSKRYLSNIDLPKGYSLFNVLPFLKSFEYFTGDDNDKKSTNVDADHNDMYSRSFSSGNKWHNIKTYNNDYTPRRVPGYDTGTLNFDQNIIQANRRLPSIRLKYKPESNKIINYKNEEPILKGRKLAMAISNQANSNKDVVSILKYNHGFLPGHSETNQSVKSHVRSSEFRNKHEFNKHVKLGNALNERNIIGNNEYLKKKSFIGGNDKIPDIQRYRSDIDNEKQNVPPSLTARVCKNMDLLDNLLYAHPDGSITMSRIMSPIKSKNIALEFIVHNYKKCSLDDSALERNYLLLINWSKTPVRLFGGAVAKRTKDLCGFF